MTGRQSVLATVGTDHHRFDRFVALLDDWAARHPDVDVFVQHGSSDAPNVPKGVEYLPYDQLAAAMTTTDAVVCHGGPTTIIEARRLGHLPIVIPRKRALGEHVDNHQVRFAKRMGSLREIVVVDNQRELDAALETAIGRLRVDSVSLPAHAGAALRISKIVNRLAI